MAGLLFAGALGAVGAGGACTVLRAFSSMHALQAFAGGCLLLACTLHVLGSRDRGLRRVPAPLGPRADLRVLIAACAAGSTLWLLAPWSMSRGEPDAPLALPGAGPERTWLCNVSLLSAPYASPHSRVLIAADPARARMLRSCAEERSKGVIETVAVNPVQRRTGPQGAWTQSARALARHVARGTYDLILTTPSPPPHAAPLGPLPYAQAALETVEGLRDLLATLSPSGVLATLLLGEPATLRWVRTLRAALPKVEGVTPERQLVVYGAGGAYTVLARGTPFSTDSLIGMNIAQRRPVPRAPDGLRRVPVWLRSRPALEFTPGAAFDNRIADEARASGNEPATQHYAFELSPATDDWPLFFESTRRDRPDTWSHGTWFRVLTWSLPLAVLLALTVAWWTTARHALRLPERARLIAAYGALALAHSLAYGYVQQRVGLWLPRTLDAPALCGIALAGSAAAWFTFGARFAGRVTPPLRIASHVAAVALLIALATVAAPSSALALRWDARVLAWCSLAALASIGSVLAWSSASVIRGTETSLRSAAATIYVAALAPAALLGPALVLASGYRSCTWSAAVALSCAILIAPRAHRA